MIQWAPFSYDIEISVRIGASYTFKLIFIKLTLKVELGARLHLYGPEFAGEVSIYWYIISFTISFGSKNSKPPNLSYMDFKNKFLPEPLKISIGDGILTEARDKKEKIPVLSPQNATFYLDSKIPLSEIKIGKKMRHPLSLKDLKEDIVGVYPMGLNKRIYTINEIELFKQENGEDTWNKIETFETFKIEEIRQNLPTALWGRDMVSPYEVSFISNVLTGIKLFLQSEYSVNKPNITSEYDVKDLEQNVIIEAKLVRVQKSASYVLEDNLDINLNLIVQYERDKRPEPKFLEKVKKVRNLFYQVIDELEIEIRPFDELKEDEIFKNPENHFLSPPIKRSLIHSN